MSIISLPASAIIYEVKKKKLRVHFMGIGGSGISAVALLAHNQGYSVTGCDLQESTPYLNKLKDLGIKIHSNHNVSHLNEIDILAVTPATYFQSELHPEVAEAKREGKLMQWQEFLGKYLQKEKTVISICGTNGKSTTTALASLVLEEAKLDPSVMIGATVKKWGTNFRIGQGQYWVTESDEFFNNFLAYTPNIIVLNNIEFDHPDFFTSFNEVLSSFEKFLNKIIGAKVLIFNQDDVGIKILFDKLGSTKLHGLNLFGYTLSDIPLISTPNSTKAKIIKRDREGTVFITSNSLSNNKVEYLLNQPGDFNVSNALGVINLATTLNIPQSTVSTILSNFEGIGRRLDKIGETKDGTVIYDDYGHHPSAIKVTLEALRQRHPQNKITAIVEPHSYSRTKQLLNLYKDAFIKADDVVIAPIFIARDKETFGVKEQDIVSTSNHKHIQALPSFDIIVDYISKSVKGNEVVVVFGAGKSYLLTQQIFTSLANP